MSFDWNPIEAFQNLTPLLVVNFLIKAVFWLGIAGITYLVVALGKTIWLFWRRSKYKRKMQFVTLAIEIPPEEIKTPKAIENIIAQLYAIKAVFRWHEKWWKGQYALQASLEIIGQDGYVQYMVHLPRKYRTLLEKAIYAQFPDALVEETEDYTAKIKPTDLVSEKAGGRYDIWGTEFVLNQPNYFPIRTYTLFFDGSGREFSDPLGAVLELMSHLKRGEQFWYQICISPTKLNWQEAGMNAIRSIVEGHGLGGEKKNNSMLLLLTRPFFHFLADMARVIMEGLFGSGAEGVEQKKRKGLTNEKLITMVPPEYDLIVKAVREKVSRLGFITYVRAMYAAPVGIFDSHRVTGDFLGMLRQFNNPQLNSLGSNRYIEVDYPDIFFPERRARRRKKRLLRRAQRRYAGAGVDEPSNFSFLQSTGARNIMSIEEIATLWHFPATELADKSGLLKRVLSKKVNPKQLLPESDEETAADSSGQPRIDLNSDINFFGRTNFRGLNRPFGIKQADRRRHMYVIGKTGMGKTTLLENMVYQDIMRGEGVAVIDPHGDLVDRIVDLIPASRINDTIYFNPADRDYPVAFNILAEENEQHRYLVVSSLVGIFKKIWADSWGPRLEYLLRNSLITLMETQGNTILGVPRIFVDTAYRKKLVSQVADPVVRSFWINEYAKYNQNFQVEAISPIQNKIGQFISIPMIRNMIGQVRSKINFREILDEKKIFLVNLAKGLIGEDVSSLLGATIISKLQIAAMMRADMTEEERSDFYLYIDEFQNFSTESFATILSEARKYRLNLVMAHQYIEQLDEMVAAAVFGNVGTMICFGVGSNDAETLEPHFATEFVLQDLVNLGKYEVILRLMVNGGTSRPFSASTLSPLGSTEFSSRDKIIRVTRERYATPRIEVEDKVRRWLDIDTNPEPALPPAGRTSPSTTTPPPRRSFAGVTPPPSSPPPTSQYRPPVASRPVARPVTPAPTQPVRRPWSDNQSKVSSTPVSSSSSSRVDSVTRSTATTVNQNHTDVRHQQVDRPSPSPVSNQVSPPKIIQDITKLEDIEIKHRPDSSIVPPKQKTWPPANSQVNPPKLFKDINIVNKTDT